MFDIYIYPDPGQGWSRRRLAISPDHETIRTAAGSSKRPRLMLVPSRDRRNLYGAENGETKFEPKNRFQL
jgi:hypothetical protein